MDCTAIIEVIRPKTLNKFRFALVIWWIVVGAILIGTFSETEINEPRFDFGCDWKGNIDKDFLRGKCYDQYWIQNYKLGIPPYLFVIANVILIPIVTFIYSQYAKSTVNELERNPQDAEGQPRNPRRNLFNAYLWQLTVSIVLAITFILFLESHLFYPKNFPSNFSCSIENSSSVNGTQSTTLFNCFNRRASDKNFWTRVVTVGNGIFAFSGFLEILWILSRGRHGKVFMEDWWFYADHLKSNSEEVGRAAQSEATPLVIVKSLTLHPPIYKSAYAQRTENTEMTLSSEHPEHAQPQKDFESAIQTLKEDCLWYTQHLGDLKQPFERPNPGEGHRHDLTMDEIYVNVAVHEGRAFHYFEKDQDRLKQLKEYPPVAEDCHFTKPQDIIDENHKNVLVVGRPMIGKTSLSTNILRLWASGEAFNGDEHYKAHFDVVFLLKFRRFNDYGKLTLRELLAGSESVEHLYDDVWDFVKSESTKVLLIFDGVDEYSGKQEINSQENYKNNVEEKMPVSVLYNKLATGQLLRGASILTTTRPTALKYVRHVGFQRVVEIRGFTSEQVEEYVEKFTRDVPGAKEKMLEHIKSNINLFSLSYIPMKCFLICHCLLQIILSESSQALPTKITDIYEVIVKMAFFNHNREGFSPEELARLKSTHMCEPFENFPEELQKIFNRLGEIAFKGIKEGRLLFESNEVSGLEDCGLLQKLPALKPKALRDPLKFQFCFTHLTLQEFFAAKHVVNTKRKVEIERIVHNHIGVGTWQVVLQFVAGLLKSSSSHIFIKLLPKSTEKITNNERSSKPETLTSWPATEEDKHLAVQVCKCLYEINDEQQPVLQNKIEKINFNAVSFSGCLLAPTDLAAVLHFLENAEEVLYIDLSFSEFGDLGANEVKKFIVNRERKLKWLNLGRNNFTDKAVKDLAAALEHSNCKLEYLDLRVINFSKKGCQYLTDAAEHSNCKVLFW